MHGILGRRHREEKMRDAERGAMKRADEESRFVLPSVLTFFGWKIIGFEYFGGILYLSIYIHYRIYQSYLFPSPLIIMFGTTSISTTSHCTPEPFSIVLYITDVCCRAQ